MSEEKKLEEVTPAPQKKTGRHEHILGTVLLVLIVLFILLSVAGLGWVGYGQWHHAQEEGEKPTIQTLDESETSQDDVTQTQPENKNPESAEENQSQETSVEVVLKDVDMAVLNGGGASGAAGKLAEALKKEGIEKIEVGSTEADFSGDAIYYAADQKGAAEKVFELVKKEYPKVELKEADDTKSETKKKTITVILGASS